MILVHSKRGAKRSLLSQDSICGLDEVDAGILRTSIREMGVPHVVPSRVELAEHKSEFDCWTAYNGKVYNITQYMHYHPGGVKYLMAGAGKDCTKEFDKFHRWVNIDNILAKCYVGPLMDDTPS